MWGVQDGLAVPLALLHEGEWNRVARVVDGTAPHGTASRSATVACGARSAYSSGAPDRFTQAAAKP